MYVKSYVIRHTIHLTIILVLHENYFINHLLHFLNANSSLVTTRLIAIHLLSVLSVYDEGMHFLLKEGFENIIRQVKLINNYIYV